MYFREDGKTYRLHREIAGVRDSRIVTHLDVSTEDAERAAAILGRL